MAAKKRRRRRKPEGWKLTETQTIDVARALGESVKALFGNASLRVSATHREPMEHYTVRAGFDVAERVTP